PWTPTVLRCSTDSLHTGTGCVVPRRTVVSTWLISRRGVMPSVNVPPFVERVTDAAVLHRKPVVATVDASGGGARRRPCGLLGVPAERHLRLPGRHVHPERRRK